MADETLTCQDCKCEFEFSEGERAWFAEKGFDPPKRCKPCRKANKEKRGSHSHR